jgi:hypothetical protein
MNKLHAKHVSASEAGGDYFQVMFEAEWESDQAYFLIQRQFEMPDDGSCYVETRQEAACGHFKIRQARLSRNRLRIRLPQTSEADWDITFALDDATYEEMKAVLATILSPPNRLDIAQS